METRAYALARNKIPVRCYVYEDSISASLASMLPLTDFQQAVFSQAPKFDDTNARFHESACAKVF